MMKLRTPARRRLAQRYRSGMGPRLYESEPSRLIRGMIWGVLLSLLFWVPLVYVCKRVLGW